jgi:hypothetical protein
MHDAYQCPESSAWVIRRAVGSKATVHLQVLQTGALQVLLRACSAVAWCCRQCWPMGYACSAAWPRLHSGANQPCSALLGYLAWLQLLQLQPLMAQRPWHPSSCIQTSPLGGIPPGPATPVSSSQG